MAAASSLGLPLGLIVGGYLLNHFAWHSIFWINVPVVLVALVAVLALVGESRAPNPPRLDIAGAVVAVLGIVALVYGFVEAPRHGWTSPATIGFVAAGVALLIGFVFWQTRTSAPLVDLALFRNERFVGGTVAVALLMFVLYGLLFTLPQYLQAVRGNDALGTGLRLIPMMAGLMVAAVASKRLLTKIGAAGGTVAGTLIVATALAALSTISVDTSMVWIGIGLTVFGLGVGMAMTSAMDAVLGSLPRAEAGAGSGVTNTLRQIAGALGVAILGSILSSIYRDRLDAGMLQQLPAQSASIVQDSIVGATRVAHQLGPAGEALNRMAGASYTDAMSVLLLISAAAGVVGAVISGLVLRGRSIPAIRDHPAPVITAQES
jgi:Major Facilitator Superfamily